MDWFIVEALGDGTADVVLREHGSDIAYRLTNEGARTLARRLIMRADCNETVPEGAPRSVYDGVKMRKIGD